MMTLDTTLPDDAAFPGTKYNHNKFNTPEYEEQVPGMTKREYFSVMILQGMASTQNANTTKALAEVAVKAADALIQELNKRA